MTAIFKLDKEYRLTRAALVNAGVDMTGSMDALYRDWRRWRDKSESLTAADSVGVANADQWWAHHLAQFRCLIDPLHVATRAPNEHVKTGLQFAQDRILRESDVLLLCSPTPWREKGMTSLRLAQLDRKEVGATEKACLC